MTDLLLRIDADIAERRLFRPRQKILVAVSGGVDSMVLLEVLRRLAKTHKWQLMVAHLNHSLRGRSSDADERLVRSTCRRHRIPCTVGRADVKNLAAESGQSIEMAARTARHEFLERTARDYSVRTIALAHHADDQVELFFLRFLRGAGPDGLSGMNWESPSPARAAVRLVRPLLGCSKVQLLEFARQNRTAFRDDASNASVDFLRNRVRHELLPMLEKNYQPGLAQVVLRNIEILSAEAACLDQAASDWREGQVSVGFDQLHLAIQRRVLRQELIALGVAPEFEWVERLRTSPGRPVAVSTGLLLSRNEAGRVQEFKSGVVGFRADEITIEMARRAGRGRFGDLKWRWEVGSASTRRLPRFEASLEWYDADRVGASVVLRHWRPGDRFQPSGLAAPAKLQDLFVNARIPRARRHHLAVATTREGEIWWVEGLRIGERFKLCPETRRRLRWSWSRAVNGSVRGRSGPDSGLARR